MFGNHQESLTVFGSHQKFSEIRGIWIRKSHAFDLGKVGRYTLCNVFCPIRAHGKELNVTYAIYKHSHVAHDI